MSESVNVSPAEQAIDEAIAKFSADLKAATGPGAHSLAQEAFSILQASLTDLIPAIPSVAQALADAKANPVEAAVGLAAAVAPSVEPS